jgi:hypothetical protein
VQEDAQELVRPRDVWSTSKWGGQHGPNRSVPLNRPKFPVALVDHRLKLTGAADPPAAPFRRAHERGRYEQLDEGDAVRAYMSTMWWTPAAAATVGRRQLGSTATPCGRRRVAWSRR